LQKTDQAISSVILIAFGLSEKYGKKAYVVKPVVVDELMDISRITVLAEMQNVSIFHALIVSYF